MNCGNCKQSHGSVAEVKTCYAARAEVPATNFDQQWSKKVQNDAWPETRAMRPVKPSEVKREESRADLMASINRIGLEVPVGRYALLNEGPGPNDIQFIHIERPDKGKWADKTFVKRQLGPSLDRLPLVQQLGILLRLRNDVQGAMQLYGRKLGICGNCGRELTNQESRDLGIGPVCRSNLGFAA